MASQSQDVPIKSNKIIKEDYKSQLNGIMTPNAPSFASNKSSVKESGHELSEQLIQKLPDLMETI
jgi:hypothetical protein